MTGTAGTRKKDWRPVFLAALAKQPDVSKACAAAGIGRTTAYRTRQADEQFAIDWNDALNRSLDQLEAALFQRAIETDTTAAIFLLKSHRPDTYGDRSRIEHTGSIRHDLRDMTEQQLHDLADGIAAKRA